MEKEYSRRDFFKQIFSQAQGAAGELLSGARAAADVFEEAALKPAGPSESKGGFVRPPGAVEEKVFLAACTRCDDCLKACPHFVIRKAGPGLGRSVSGTPVIVPRENPCLMCGGFACIAACPTGALKMPAPNAVVRIGLAVVDEAACYLAKNQPCDYCEMHCPVEPKAVAAAPGAAPRIDPGRCTGCGKCAQICPARSIRIEARA